jgi:DNA-binding NtrC family response regulator
VFQIRVPDLRERPGDIPALVAAAVARWNESSNDPARRVPGCSEETVELLRSYDWPGNVRELMGAVEHACIVSGGKRLLPYHLPPEILEQEKSDELPTEVGTSESGRRYQAPDAEEEREIIRLALEQAQGNRTQAAAALGMGRTTLWQKLKAYGLD